MKTQISHIDVDRKRSLPQVLGKPSLSNYSFDRALEQPVFCHDVSQSVKVASTIARVDVRNAVLISFNFNDLPLVIELRGMLRSKDMVEQPSSHS